MGSVTESHYNQQQHRARENPGNGAARSVPRNRGRFRVQDIIKACRSYRRFDESDRIDRKLLTAMRTDWPSFERRLRMLAAEYKGE